MLAVTVNLLAGRYVATQSNDRSRPEWPPHPARLFSAAVAAWADHGDCDEDERSALTWWEGLGPPSIDCSLGDDLSVRHPVTHYVPVNDIMVVSRKTDTTYRSLIDVQRDLSDPELTEKDRSKAEKKLAKLADKSLNDSLKFTSGVAPDDRLEILPDQRGKQPRQYPTVVPADSEVTYYWGT